MGGRGIIADPSMARQFPHSTRPSSKRYGAENTAVVTAARREGQRGIFVRQIRSNHHIKPKTRGALRALGLRGIGDTNLLPDEPSVWGNLRQAGERIEHERVAFGSPYAQTPAPEFHHPDSRILVALDDGEVAEAVLGDPDPDGDESSPNGTSEGGGGVNSESFHIDQLGISDRIDTPEGDSVWHVRYEQGGSSITWRTTLGPAEFFVKALQRVKIEDGRYHTVEVYAGDDPTPSIMKIVELETLKGVKPEIIRLEDAEGGVAFGWQLAALQNKGAEGGIVAPTAMPRQLLEDLLVTTGTDSVKIHSHELAVRAVELES